MNNIRHFELDPGRGLEKEIKLTQTTNGEGNDEALDETPLVAATPTSLVGLSASANGKPEMGQITGSFAYPNKVFPGLRIVAFEAKNFNNYYYTEVYSGSTYSIDLPPGVYFVLAYLINPDAMGAEPGLVGIYSQDVSCSLHVDCSGQSLTPVQVKPGQVVEDIKLEMGISLDEQKEHWPSDPIKSERGSINRKPGLRVIKFHHLGGGFQPLFPG